MIIFLMHHNNQGVSKHDLLLKLGLCLNRDLGDMILFLMHRNNQKV